MNVMDWYPRSEDLRSLFLLTLLKDMAGKPLQITFGCFT